MKINPVDKVIAEKQAKSVIDRLKENKIDVNTLTQSDLNIMAEQIVHPLKHADILTKKVIPKESAKVIQFPKDRITDWTKPRPVSEGERLYLKKTGLDEGKVIDTNFNPNLRKTETARTETLASPTRIKQGFSTQSKLNNWSSNQQWVKDFIGRKNKEFNSLSKADQKEVLEMFEAQIKKRRNG